MMVDPRLRLILAWTCNCLALLVAAAVVPTISYGNDLGTLLLAGAILGLANFALRPLVILMALPAVVLSLGVALLFVNALMLWVTSVIVPDLRVGGFWSTVAAPVSPPVVCATATVQSSRASWAPPKTLVSRAKRKPAVRATRHLDRLGVPLPRPGVPGRASAGGWSGRAFADSCGL
jgi:putative membrane protein